MTTPTKKKDTEQTAAQHEAQLRRVLDKWATTALETLAEDLDALETPEGVRKIEPRLSDALQRTLRTIGTDAVRSWVVRPPGPKPAEWPRQEPSKESLARAEQRKRIEDSYVYTFDQRRFVNEDRARAGLPPLPEDEASTSDE